MRKALSIILLLTLTCYIGATSRAALSDSISITGVGDVVYPELDIHDVMLPTAGSLDFILDPLGLLSIDAGQSARIDDLRGGLIVHPGDGRIVNNSSHSVKVSVSLWADSTDGGFEGGTVATFLGYSTDDETTIGSVEADDNVENNILLYVVPFTVNLAAQDAQAISADTGYIITADSITLDFILPGAQYDVAAGDLVASPIPGTGSGVGFQIGGYINKNADWRDFIAAYAPSTITVYASFTITKADPADMDAFDAATTAGMPAVLTPDTVGSLKLVPSAASMGQQD